MLTRRIKHAIGYTLVLAAALGGVACSSSATSSGTPAANGPLTASGFIEAVEVSVVAETSGRAEQVLADQGDTVTAGQVIVVLDDALLQSARAQAVASLHSAQANLADLQSGPREQEVAAAQAALDQANASLAGAKQSAGQAWSSVANPRDINVQIASAQIIIAQAQQQITGYQGQVDSDQYMLDQLRQQDKPDKTRMDFLQYDIELQRTQIATAQAQIDGAQAKINQLSQQRARPLTLIAAADHAQSQIPIAQGQVDLTQAQYDQLINGPLPEEIAIAEGQVRLAKAQVALIDARIAQLKLIAPIDGVVTTRSISVGETASPGVPLLNIADLSTLKLVVYIPETQIGQVMLGSQVDITVDSYTGQTFVGEVVNIGQQAEFTPRNVQTEEERVNLVFAVEIHIDNTDGRLKPGMPADVTIHGLP